MSLLTPIVALCDLRELYAYDLPFLPLDTGGKLSHIHGTAYNPLDDTLFVAVTGVDFGKPLENAILELPALISDSPKHRAVSITHLRYIPVDIRDDDVHRVYARGEGIQDIAFDERDRTLYFAVHNRTVVNIDLAGNVLRYLYLREPDAPDVNGGGLAILDDSIWIQTASGAMGGIYVAEFDLETGIYKNKRFKIARTGLASDSDHNLLWTSNYPNLDEISAYDPITGRMVYQSSDIARVVKRDGHNAAYGGGRLWIGSEGCNDRIISLKVL